jgi:hypothetical protein
MIKLKLELKSMKQGYATIKKLYFQEIRDTNVKKKEKAMIGSKCLSILQEI